MVIYPEAFFEELDAITQAGIDAEGRLFISDRAQVILDAHARLDQAREAARGAARSAPPPAASARPTRPRRRASDCASAISSAAIWSFASSS